MTERDAFGWGMAVKHYTKPTLAKAPVALQVVTARVTGR